MIASLHAITQLHDADAVRSNIYDLAALYIAMLRYNGVDESTVCIFDQAQVPAHARAWRIMSCLTHMWFMERMHAYKDATAKGNAWQVSVGTFNYPILMAVDVLLYWVTHVPVWKDQKQHLEFARDMAQKVNSNFGEVFVVPEPYIQEDVATIQWLDGQKMSKSYNNFIGLLEDEKTIRKKVARIPTAAIAIDDPKNPDEDNVYALRKLFLDEEQDAVVRARYTAWGLSYKDAKQELGDCIVALTTWIQAELARLDPETVKGIVRANTLHARTVSDKHYAKFHQAVGFTTLEG